LAARLLSGWTKPTSPVINGAAATKAKDLHSLGKDLRSKEKAVLAVVVGLMVLVLGCSW